MGERSGAGAEGRAQRRRRRAAPSFGRRLLIPGIALGVAVAVFAVGLALDWPGDGPPSHEVPNTAWDGPAGPPAGPKPAARPATEPVDPGGLPGTRWYGAYLQGHKVGYSCLVTTREERDGAPVIVMGSDTVLFRRVGGRTEKGELSRRTVYDAGGAQRLRAVWSRDRTGGMEVERRAVRQGDEFVAHTRENGRAGPKRRIWAPDIRLRDAEASRVLLAGDPGVGATVDVPVFDLKSLSTAIDTLTVDAVGDATRDGAPVRVYTLRRSHGRTGGSSVAKVLATGRLLESVTAGVLLMRAEPEAVAKDVGEVPDLSITNAILPDQPLGDPRSLRRLVLLIGGVGSLEIPSDGRQQVQREADGALLVTIDARASAAQLATPTAEELAAARRATLEFDCDHPDIQAVTRRVVGDAATDRQRAVRILRWVSDHIDDGDSLGAPTAVAALRRAHGDCKDHTLLFVAMARAAGLAARRVSGVMYGTDREGFVGHAWAEVALGGRWVAMDPTWNQPAPDATHLRLGAAGRMATFVRFLHSDVQITVVRADRYPRSGK